MKKGFTLIELLVVIAIIGVLTSVLLVNMVGIRGRASDVKRKSDLKQLKNALRLYYNDYQHYPWTTDPEDVLPQVDTEFSRGGTVYMKQAPTEFEYYSDGNESFILQVTLENASDQEAVATQARCNPASKAFYTNNGGQAPTSADYYVCED